MRWNARLFLAASLACLLSSASARAAEGGAVDTVDNLDAPQAEHGVLLDTIRGNRRAFVAVNLALSPEEAERFWPLYERYQKEITAIGDRLVAIIDDYAASFPELRDDKALQLMEGYLANEAERLQVRRTYFSEFSKILSGRTVARFYQLENKMDAVVRYDLAATIPVVDEGRDTPAK